MLKTEFLNKIKDKYPDNLVKYDYSLLPNEFRAKGKVKIICNVHGIFEQEGREHLRSRGCYKCSKSYKPTTEEFINKARVLHKDLYNYSKVNYINNYTKVIIVCPTHGDFEQIPVSHLTGYGCSRCATEKTANLQRFNTKDFIDKARLRHGDRYNYSKVNYVNAFTKVIITCLTHGDFLQEANSHLSGTGCSKCFADNLRFNTGEWINKVKSVHNNKYDYCSVKYVNQFTHVKIKCPIHGNFLQLPKIHLKGSGCPKCQESKGENNIAIILDSINIQYIRERTVDGYRYRYDFYLPEYDIYIEYHGRQHYVSVDFFGGKKGFIKQKRRDRTKIELIKRSTGLLIVLDYKAKTLDEIRTELLRIFGIIHPRFLDDKKMVKECISKSKVYLFDKSIMKFRK